MENNIFLTVMDVFDNNESKNNVETYSNILANISVFDYEVIKNTDALKQTLLDIINGRSDKKGNQSTDAIVGNYNKHDLFDHLVNYLTYRYYKEEKFYGVSFIASKLGRLEHIKEVIIEDYKMLRNPFMYSQELFFHGNILQDFIDNPNNYDHKERQIILEGSDGGQVYAKLTPDNQILIRELLRMGKEWFIRGSLDFDHELMMNVVDVIKVYSEMSRMQDQA